MVSISIIMPALNEEKHILVAINSSLKAIDKLALDGEIIVVNDGSTDMTKEITEEAMKRDSRIRVINHDVSQGLGKAFWVGVDNMRGNLVCTIPGDNENDAYEILRYHKLLEHVDIVIPFVYNKDIRSIFRVTLSFVYKFIINSTFFVNLNYTNGTVLYRKAILKELEYRSSSFFFQTDILIRLIKGGYLFAEVPYRLNTRSEGISKALSFPSLLHVMGGYLRLVKDQYLREKKIGIEKNTSTSERYKDSDAESTN